MKKVRVLKSKKDITIDKQYEVVEEYNGFYTIKDDVGDYNDVAKRFCEEVKESNYVLVRDSDDELWVKRILLHDLGSQFECRYVTVGVDYMEEYVNGGKVNGVYSWKQMKPINEVGQKIEELEQKLAELKQQLNK